MKFDWSLVLTLVAALFLSSVFNRVVIPKVFRNTSNTLVPTGDWLEDHLAAYHPDIKR